MKKTAILIACATIIASACTTTNRSSRLKDGSGAFAFPAELKVTGDLFVKIPATKTVTAFESGEASLNLISEKIPPVLTVWAPCNTSTTNQVQVSHGSETEKTFCIRAKAAEDVTTNRHLVEFSDKAGLESFLVASVSKDDKLNNFWRLSTLCSRNEVEIFGLKTRFELREEMPLPTVPNIVPGTQPLLATVTTCNRSAEVDNRKIIFRFAGYGIAFPDGTLAEVLYSSRDPKDQRATFEFARDLQLKSMDALLIRSM
jgi:hypothetical protein